MGPTSIDVEEGIQVEQSQGKLTQRLFVQELQGEFLLAACRSAAGGQQVRTLDLLGVIRAGLSHQTRRERIGQAMRGRAIEQFKSLQRVCAGSAARATRRRVRLVERL